MGTASSSRALASVIGAAGPGHVGDEQVDAPAGDAAHPPHCQPGGRSGQVQHVEDVAAAGLQPRLALGGVLMDGGQPGQRIRVADR
jgi:hypothetical protein